MPTDEDEVYLAEKLIADAEDLRSAGYKSIPMFGATPAAIEAYIT